MTVERPRWWSPGSRSPQRCSRWSLCMCSFGVFPARDCATCPLATGRPSASRARGYPRTPGRARAQELDVGVRGRTWSANRASLAAAHDDQDSVGESLGAVKRLLTSYRELLHSRLLADRRGAEQAVSSSCRLFPSTVPHGYQNVLRHMVVLVRDVVLNADARSKPGTSQYARLLAAKLEGEDWYAAVCLAGAAALRVGELRRCAGGRTSTSSQGRSQ